MHEYPHNPTPPSRNDTAADDRAAGLASHPAHGLAQEGRCRSGSSRHWRARHWRSGTFGTCSSGCSRRPSSGRFGSTICATPMRRCFSRRADHVRQPAARTSRRVDYAPRVRPLVAGCFAARGGSARHAATICNPRATIGGSKDQSIRVKSFVFSGDPDSHQLEPDGELAEPAPRAPRGCIVKRGRSLRVTSS